MRHSSKKSPAPLPLPRSWRRAIDRMDQALEENAPADYSEQIDLLGRQLFGHLWEYKGRDSND